MFVVSEADGAAIRLLEPRITRLLQQLEAAASRWACVMKAVA
jgi:hypothetical protein